MKRLEDHESFEMAFLNLLASHRLTGALVFGGGTMLRLCHELPRYSIDLDFWFYKETDFSAFFRRLRDAASAGYEITDAQEKFHSLLVEMRRARGTTKLKIEVRKKVAPTGSSEQKIAFSPHFPSQVLVRGFTLKKMFKNKVSALIERGEVRDAFDLEFLLRKGIEPDLSDEERKAVMKRLKGFKKKDFDVKLGSIILPDVREYYRVSRFAFLEEKLTFEDWNSKH
jgi:predicted nucleotidyltransferase component of viral defense system